jgi:hypothetical protein
MTAAHILPNVFPSENSSATYMHCFLRYIQHHSYLLYITSTRTVIPFIYMTYSHFHFLRSSWQAGCPWSFVFDTESILRKKTHIIFSPPSALFSRIFDTLRDSSMKILVFCFFVESTLNEPQGHTQNFFRIWSWICGDIQIQLFPGVLYLSEIYSAWSDTPRNKLRGVWYPQKFV